MVTASAIFASSASWARRTKGGVSRRRQARPRTLREPSTKTPKYRVATGRLGSCLEGMKQSQR